MDLSAFIKTKPLILMDGATGTQLALAGLEMGGQNCIFHAEEVLAVHKKYAEIGCDILTTDTLTMNRISIETHGVEVDVKAVNKLGATIARSAASKEQYVLGDISSTGQLLEPYGEYSEEQFYTTFMEQADYLLVGRVDGFIIETMIDSREGLCAARSLATQPKNLLGP